MKFNVNDLVAVVDDVIKGKVVRITNQNISIEDENGFQYTFHASQLVKTAKDIEKNLFESGVVDKEASEAIKKPTLITNKNKQQLLEVDLHAHNLTPNERSMSNFEILSLQLNVAEQKLRFAMSKRISKVVFIHGIGEGVLKTELYKLLKKFPVDVYDASYQKYGRGATEVYIFQNR